MATHPLRLIRALANEALAGLSAEFEVVYSHTGRPGIAPERLLQALLLQAFYSIRSERRLMEELKYNLLYRWFVGLGIDKPVWDATVFCKNRDRLLSGGVAARFLASLLALPRVKALLSDEHFSFDGTLIAAWASIKSFRPKDGSGNDGLLSRATGDSERLAAEVMMMRWHDRRSRITLGADKAYDAADFLSTCRNVRVTPHVVQNTAGRRSNMPEKIRWEHRLRRQPEGAKVYRGGVRLGQDNRPPGQDPPPRARQRRLAVHPRRLQPDPTAETDGGANRMNTINQACSRRYSTVILLAINEPATWPTTRAKCL